jgi:hypothetical protein
MQNFGTLGQLLLGESNGGRKKKKKNNKNSGLPKLLHWSHAQYSKAILGAKSGQRVTTLIVKSHHVEDQLKTSYDKRKDDKEKDVVNKIKTNPVKITEIRAKQKCSGFFFFACLQ